MGIQAIGIPINKINFSHFFFQWNLVGSYVK